MKWERALPTSYVLKYCIFYIHFVDTEVKRKSTTPNSSLLAGRTRNK
jgi:hypothetical protein